MHREGRDIIIGFALFNKSPSSRGLFSSKIISFCAIQCFSGTRLSPLNFSLLRFLRRLICRTPKVPFSFPLLLFVRVSFNPHSRSSFSFPYLRLSFTAHPLHQLPLPLSLSVMFPQLFQPPPPEAIPFPPAAFLLTPFSPSHPTTFRVVYHFSSASGNPLFPIHQSSTGASFPWNVPRFPLRISITNFRQSNYSLRKEQKSVRSFSESCGND